MIWMLYYGIISYFSKKSWPPFGTNAPPLEAFLFGRRVASWHRNHLRRNPPMCYFLGSSLIRQYTAGRAVNCYRAGLFKPSDDISIHSKQEESCSEKEDRISGPDRVQEKQEQTQQRDPICSRKQLVAFYPLVCKIEVGQKRNSAD